MKINKILAVRNDRFGEFLLNIPALRAIKESFPGTRLTLAVNSYVEELAKCVGDVDDIIVWENRKHSLREISKFIIQLKRNKFDACIVLNPSKEFNLMSFLAVIPLRVGYDRKWGLLLTRRLKDAKHLGEKHEIEYNLDLVGLIGCRTEDKQLRLNISAEVLATLKRFGREEGNGSVIIHPWTSDPIKQWPLDNFRILACKVSKELKQKVIIVGGKEECARGNEYFGNLGENTVNLTGRTTLLQLAGILARCKLLISGDSGPVHLACAVSTPVIALFRNDIPAKSARRWGPWGEGHIVIEKPNLSDIKVEEVLEKVRSKLKI